MGVRINATVWNSIFAVPTCIVDEHIKMAGGQQLKVLLYVFRHNNEDIDTERIAQGTGLSAADAKDAMQYWIEVGLLSRDGEEKITPAAEVQVNTKSGVTVSADTRLSELPDVVPTYQQVAARTLECSEIRALFNEAQLRLGKTIGYDAQAKLLMMHDCYGLPVEVILTIIEYSVSRGKDSLKYIEKVAKDWAENEINTLEAADKHIKKILATEKLWTGFVSMFSVDPPNFTEKRCTYLKKWHFEHKQSLELIYYACEETVNRINKIRFEYMDAMLEKWYEQKLKSPVEVIKAEKEYAASRTANSGALASGSSNGNSNGGAGGRGAGGANTGSHGGARGYTLKNSPPAVSYDLDKYKQRAKGPIEYKRRNSND